LPPRKNLEEVALSERMEQFLVPRYSLEQLAEALLDGPEEGLE
jgi:hypothetical protein